MRPLGFGADLKVRILPHHSATGGACSWPSPPPSAASEAWTQPGHRLNLGDSTHCDPHWC